MKTLPLCSKQLKVKAEIFRKFDFFAPKEGNIFNLPFLVLSFGALKPCKLELSF